MIQGYIYENERGGLLTKEMFWFQHDVLEDGYVHQVDIEKMRSLSINWNSKPVRCHKAVYNPETNHTEIITQNIPF